MKGSSLKRYLIENTGKNNDAMWAAVNWLEENGGGTIVTDLKRNMMDSFDLNTEGEFDKFEKRMAARSIRLSWKRRGIPHRGNIVALYTTRSVIMDIEEFSENVDSLFVLGWTESDWLQWREEFNPTLMVVEK